MGARRRLLWGCLLAPLAIVLALLVIGAGLALMPAPEVRPVRTEEAVPISLPPPAVGAAGVRESGPQERRRIRIELSEGDFRLVPAPGETEVRVEGAYDAGSYRLEVEREEGGARVRLRRTTSGLRVLKAWRRSGAQRSNEVTVHLPDLAPIDLELSIRRASGRIDLSGLPIASLSLDLRMGDFGVRFDGENPVEMERCTLRASMGEVRLSGLARARVRDLRLHGAMGDLEASFDGPAEGDLAVAVSMRMGDARLSLPEGLRWRSSRAGAFLGEARVIRPPAAPEDAPALDLTARATLGSVTVR